MRTGHAASPARGRRRRGGRGSAQAAARGSAPGGGDPAASCRPLAGGRSSRLAARRRDQDHARVLGPGGPDGSARRDIPGRQRGHGRVTLGQRGGRVPSVGPPRSGRAGRERGQAAATPAADHPLSHNPPSRRWTRRRTPKPPTDQCPHHCAGHGRRAGVVATMVESPDALLADRRLKVPPWPNPGCLPTTSTHTSASRKTPFMRGSPRKASQLTRSAD